MIPRYDKKEISALWTDESKFHFFLQAELAIMLAQEKYHDGKIIPHGTADKIRDRVHINCQRIEEIESVVKHDVIAFCSSITEQIPTELGKFFHFGVTSSDIIDTALSLQIRASLDLILPVFRKLLHSLYNFADRSKEIVTLGRSHGMFAEPMSFGQKFLGHYAEFARRYQELQNFYDHHLTAQFSGAVGNFTILSPQIEELAASYLKLKVESVSTQVIPRDHVAKMVQITGLVASAIERLCVEIRHLHRSDVHELHEGFSKGQKGSSIMPHKKNPISAENLSGLARVLRSHCTMALENIVLWHERDISHSSSERLYLPDHFGILYYALGRLNSTIENLQLHKEDIEKKVLEHFSYLSSYYLHHLLERNNITREEVYEMIQKAAFAGDQDKNANRFFDELVIQLQSKKLNFNLKRPDMHEIKAIYLKGTQQVFARTLRNYPLL